MSLWAIGFGIALGVVIFWISLRQRILSTGLFLSITAVTIALFYPLFDAIHAIDDTRPGLTHRLGHGVVVLFFLAVSIWTVTKHPVQAAITMLAVLILAHGLFDAAIMGLAPSANTGPKWWPEFCAAVDITLGISLLTFQKRVPT